jgi:hypothetical protein
MASQTKKTTRRAEVAKRPARSTGATDTAEERSATTFPSRTESEGNQAREVEALMPTPTTPTAPAVMVPYDIQCRGRLVPPFLDDCLSRAVLKSKVLTGQGDKSVVIDFEPQAAQCAVTGFESTGLSASFDVTASYDAAAKTLNIKAPAAVKWSVLVLYQKGIAA